jgi:hypothetical protein
MKYQEWKLIAESIGSAITLGVSRPQIIGSPFGSQFAEEGFKDGEDVEDSDESDERKFPPDEADDMDNQTGSSCASPKFMSKSYMDDMEDDDVSDDMDDSEEGMGDDMSDDEGMGDDMSDAMDDDMSDDEGMGDDMSDVMDDEGGNEKDDMGFLNDIDPALMGDESDSDMGDEPSMDGDEDAAMGGDIDAEPVIDDNGDMHKDTMELMKKMAAYCGKYMKAEAKQMDGNDPEDMPEKPKKTIKKDAKKDVKHMGKSCHCENNDLADSLAKNMKLQKPVSEDALFGDIDVEDEIAPGSVGFAPQGRMGSIGGGYTKDDFADIPVLGECHRLPTLKDWRSFKKARQN